MMWTDDEFDDLIDFFGGSVPNIFVGLAEGYNIKPTEIKKIILKTDEITEDFAKQQRKEGENYRSPYEIIIKENIESITEIGDGISKFGVLVKFTDGDKQKVLTDDIQADIDTSILLCVFKHIAKVNGDKNGSHALNRVMLAIKKKREKIMTSSIENTIKKGLNKDRKRKKDNINGK